MSPDTFRHNGLPRLSGIVKLSLKTGNFVLIFTKQGGLWFGITGGLSTRDIIYVKPIGALENFKPCSLNIAGGLLKNTTNLDRMLK